MQQGDGQQVILGLYQYRGIMIMTGKQDYNDKAYYYIQTNNVFETIFAKIFKKHLESCGATTATMLADFMGANVRVRSVGGWSCQPEDYLMLYLNDKRNYSKFRKARNNLDPAKFAGNRVPQYYPVALKDVFDIDAVFSFGISKHKIIDELSKKNALMVCLKNPGHYIAIMAYDETTNEVIFNDPYPSRRGLKNKGFNERIHINKLLKNLKPFVVSVKNRRTI